MDNRLLKDYLNTNRKSKFSRYITKSLIMIIILLCSLIYVSLNDQNLSKFKKYVFENNFNFAKFNNLYHKINKNNSEVVSVSKTTELVNPQNYLDGMFFEVDNNYPVKTISSGIVIFIGPKEGYGNTVVIQGSDGYDIWYSSLDNISVKMYDYVKEGSFLGEVQNKLYLVITKDGQNYTYEEYQNKV